MVIIIPRFAVSAFPPVSALCMVSSAGFIMGQIENMTLEAFPFNELENGYLKLSIEK